MSTPTKEISEKIKIITADNVPSYWERFDRLQRTAHKLAGSDGTAPGVYRFETFEELEEWKMNQRLNHRGRRSNQTW